MKNSTQRNKGLQFHLTPRPRRIFQKILWVFFLNQLYKFPCNWKWTGGLLLISSLFSSLLDACVSWSMFHRSFSQQMIACEIFYLSLSSSSLRKGKKEGISKSKMSKFAFYNLPPQICTNVYHQWHWLYSQDFMYEKCASVLWQPHPTHLKLETFFRKEYMEVTAKVLSPMTETLFPVT